MKTRNIVVVVLTILIATFLHPHTYASQKTTEQELLPIIDMHCHATNTGPNFGTIGFRGLKASETPEKLFEETYGQFRRFNIVKAVVSGPLDCVEYWKSKDEDDRIIRGILDPEQSSSLRLVRGETTSFAGTYHPCSDPLIG